MAKWNLKHPSVTSIMEKLDILIDYKYLDCRFDDLVKDLDMAEEIVEDDDLWNRVRLKHNPGERRKDLRDMLETVRSK